MSLKKFWTIILVLLTFIKRHFKYVALVILLVIGWQILFKKEAPVVIPGEGGQPVTLKKGEKEVVGIVGRKITVVKRTHGGKVKVATRYIPPDGGAKITIKEDGTVEVTVRNKGWAFSPGLGIYYADTFRPSLDVNLAYCNRLGFNAGLGFGKHPVAVPFAAINYAWGNIRFQNTALMVGYDARSHWLVGIRVRF